MADTAASGKFSIGKSMAESDRNLRTLSPIPIRELQTLASLYHTQSHQEKLMEFNADFAALVENLKTERDEILVKLHLASMEVKDEFEALEPKWDAILQNCAELSDDTLQSSDEVLTKAKLIGEEIKQSYQRIRSILSD